MSATSFAALVEEARKDGYEAGVAAGSWVIDGNTPVRVARWFVAGLEDGDPEVIDQLPSCPLSGEWAGGPTPATLAEDYGLDEGSDVLDEVCDAFEDGFAQGVHDEVERSARAVL